VGAGEEAEISLQVVGHWLRKVDGQVFRSRETIVKNRNVDTGIAKITFGVRIALLWRGLLLYAQVALVQIPVLST
jgi:hypothetical protein